MPSVPLNFPVSAWLSCTHYSAPSQAGLLCKPGAWMAGLAAGWPWLWCSPRGFAPVFGAALTGNKSFGLSQCRLQGGGGRTLCGCLQQLAVVGKRVSETREKRKGALKPVFSVPPWPVLVPVLSSPGLHSFHSSLGCQPRALLSASIMGYWQLQCMSLHGPALDTCLGWELGARGGLSGTPRPRSSGGSHCSAGLSSSAKDLRVQSRQQELSHVKPRGYMEKQSETWWP